MVEMGTPAEEGGCLLPPETQEEMATIVASTRETVARALAAWRRAGIVTTRERRVIVLDLDRLRAEVRSDGIEG
jgi:CRP-like cAMP-binding protein